MSAGAQPRRGGRARTKRSFGDDFTPEGRKTEAAQAGPAGPGIAAGVSPRPPLSRLSQDQQGRPVRAGACTAVVFLCAHAWSTPSSGSGPLPAPF